MTSKEDFCPHTEDVKTYSTEIEPFSEKYDSEYQFCYCKVCDKRRYTGTCKFVSKQLNRVISGAKEQNMSKLSVSGTIKARHAKDEAGLSLKEFARRLAAAGDETAQNWFDNKAGACNASRSDKAKGRIDQERTATRVAKRKSKGGGGKAA